MTDVASTLVKHRRRLNEIVSVLVRHGLASWAARGQGIAAVAPIESMVHRAVSRRKPRLHRVSDCVMR